MDTIFPDIKKSRIGIIYVYYERKNQQKNQTNLSFFIKYGLGTNKWLNLNVETLFVINGHLCDVIIPSKPNIHVLKQNNCHDFEGWLNGMTFFEKKYNQKIWELFDYLCLINASCIGPIYDENINDHWLMPFYNRMIKYNSVLVSPCISFFGSNHPAGVGPRVVPIFNFLRCTKNIIHLITNTSISYLDDTYQYKDDSELKNNVNTVCGYKSNKPDAVLTGEYGLSRVLLSNGYRIACMLYDFDCNNSSIWSKYDYGEPDRYNAFNKKNIPLSTIFIKNIWRVPEGFYVCQPVLYDECIQFMYDKLKMTPLIKNNNYNYDLLNVPTTNNYGIGWDCKEYYYNMHGRVEEDIIFVKPNPTNNKNCAIYAHYDSDNIIKDYVFQSINALISVGYNIIFYTASKTINNIDECILPFKINYINNEGPGTHWLIWECVCNKLKKENIIFDNILLLNDSILFPINGIDNFKNTIETMRQTSDFWGHWESPEISWHIIAIPFEFKYKMLSDVVFFLNLFTNIFQFQQIEHRREFAKHYAEVRLAKYLVDLGYKYNVVIKSNLLDTNVTCPVFHPINLYKWINKTKSFAIKWKYNISYIHPELISPELNYLTRFLYPGKFGTISEAEKGNAFPKATYDI